MQYPVVTKFVYAIVSMVLYLYLGSKVSHEDCLGKLYE